MKEITHPIMKIEFYFYRNCYKEPVIAWQSPRHMLGRVPSGKRLLRRADALLAMTDQPIFRTADERNYTSDNEN
jgi:hypothetical protein